MNNQEYIYKAFRRYQGLANIIEQAYYDGNIDTIIEEWIKDLYGVDMWLNDCFNTQQWVDENHIQWID